MTEAQVVKKVRGNVFSCLLKGFGLGFYVGFWSRVSHFCIVECSFLFYLIGIHSMQGFTATTRYGVTRKTNTSNVRAFRKSV